MTQKTYWFPAEFNKIIYDQMDTLFTRKNDNAVYKQVAGAALIALGTIALYYRNAPVGNAQPAQNQDQSKIWSNVKQYASYLPIPMIATGLALTLFTTHHFHTTVQNCRTHTYAMLDLVGGYMFGGDYLVVPKS
jgi:hypothetical protein